MKMIWSYLRTIIHISSIFSLIVSYKVLSVSGSQQGNANVKKEGMYVRTDAIVPCGRFDITKELCIQSGCSWIPHALNKVAPPCFYKEDTGYGALGDMQINETRYKIRLKRKGIAKMFGMDVHQYMTVEVDMYSSHALRIYFYPDERAFEVPEEALSVNKPTIPRNPETNSVIGTNKLYRHNITFGINYHYSVKFTRTPYFGIQVIRKSSGTVIFNTTLPGLTFSKQFLQISTKLPTANLYGFGENIHEKFRHDMNWKLWSIFARASKPIGEWNWYGAQPVYMNLENDGKANMVFLKNSNAMDIFLQPNPYPAITYRPIGGVLDFYVYLGSSPEETLQYYTETSILIVCYANNCLAIVRAALSIKTANCKTLDFGRAPNPTVSIRSSGSSNRPIYCTTSGLKTRRMKVNIIKTFTMLKNKIPIQFGAIGRPLMPPYWSLGFHLCRWGFESVSDIEAVVERNKRAGIPQDGQWLDIDYMDQWFIFTYAKDKFRGLPAFVDKLHSEGQRFGVTTNPGVGTNMTTYNEVKANRFGYHIYEDGYYQDVFIKSADGQILQGESWNGVVAYVDFTCINRTVPWWEHYINYFYNLENIKIDGLLIDKNEPDNGWAFSLEQCTNNKRDNPPYLPYVLDGGNKGGCMYGRTICMDSQHYWGRHYDVHNLFGHSMSIVTNRALNNIFKSKRPFLITRSTFAGTGKYAATWLGDNASEWKHMAESIIGILEHGLFGFSMVGADICGFNGPTDYEMCVRWTQLGAFYPLARNHNRILMRDQDPAAWDDRFITIVREALLTRYRILPYMYTLFHDAHVYGKTVARPLMFEFPKDKSTWDIYKQFLLGPAFMVSPVLELGKRTVDAYIPKGRWYNYLTGIETKYTEKFQTLKAPLDVINLHLRGGYILPVQEPANTTVYSRRRPMGLLVNFDETYNSNGHLFWDDGESKDTFENGNYLFLTFNASKAQYLDIIVIYNNYPEADRLYFGSIEFYGMNALPRDVYINGHYLNPKQIQYNTKIVKLINLNLKITNNHKLRWMLEDDLFVKDTCLKGV